MARARAFEQWYAGEHPRLFASLVVLTGDREVAAEATDEALSRALQHWERVAEMDSPEGWTYRVAVNIVRRGARRRALERRLLGRLVSRGATPAPAGEVWDLVRSLTARQQQAVVLRYVADLAEADIARVMGVTRGTVASTLAHARRALGGALREPDVAEEPS
ncbi:MAG: polymerase sigma-70 factor, subfamily [Actinomycetota bacterium]|jgi:RNA polymerase sigma-70 factor (ECF subfamily)|nr:polymerase sigma-70 factor, subfamily [Actinomycetota bacterium]